MVVQDDRLVADPKVHFSNELLLFGELGFLERLPLLLEKSREGKGRGIIVVHGMLSFDSATLLLRRYLENHGYKNFQSGVGINTVCLNKALTILIQHAEEAFELNGHQRLAGIGHSMGGLLARAAANKRPDLFDLVIAIGSPVNSLRVAPVLSQFHAIAGRFFAKVSDCGVFSSRCYCEIVGSFGQDLPKNVAHHSIFSLGDGVVHWESCCESEASCNHLVVGTHFGLTWNVQVLRLVRKLLRENYSIA